MEDVAGLLGGCGLESWTEREGRWAEVLGKGVKTDWDRLGGRSEKGMSDWECWCFW